MMSQYDDAPMRLLGSYRCAFICEPIEICRMRVVVVLDGPVLDCMEVIQIPTDCFERGWRNSRPQGTAKNGDMFAEVEPRLVEENECAQSRVRQPLRTHPARKLL